MSTHVVERQVVLAPAVFILFWFFLIPFLLPFLSFLLFWFFLLAWFFLLSWFFLLDWFFLLAWFFFLAWFFLCPLAGSASLASLARPDSNLSTWFSSSDDPAARARRLRPMARANSSLFILM